MLQLFSINLCYFWVAWGLVGLACALATFGSRSALVWVMVWHQTGDKPLSEMIWTKMTYFICITRPQWINSLRPSAAYIYVSKLTIIGSDNGLTRTRRQAIFQTNTGVLLIWPLGTNCSETIILINTFSFKKMHLKMLSGKCRPFCLSLNVFKALFDDSVLLYFIILIPANCPMHFQYSIYYKHIYLKHLYMYQNVVMLPLNIFQRCNASNIYISNTCSLGVVSGAKTRILHKNKVNTMAADALASCISRPSAVMI